MVKTGKHIVTAITRTDSTGSLPKGVEIARVSYDDDGQSLISALQGQEFLAITLPAREPPGLHSKIVNAAAKAGVPYIMPNAYGMDINNKALRESDLYSSGSLNKCLEVEKLGSSYVAMVCGMWYEWSLALGEQWFGFDLKNKTVTFFDDGKTYVSTSTWMQCGRAFAALLSLPENDASPALSEWKNKPLYLASFRINQRDMLDSIHRVTGTTDKDWKITYEPTAVRYKAGLEDMQKGIMTGFAKAMYSRVFFPNGDGDYESSQGLCNDLLGLPKEDLDEATKRTLDMVESGWNPFA